MAESAPPSLTPLNATIVAFDLDNTLIDIVNLKRRAAEAAAWALADAGMNINPEKGAAAIIAIAFEIGLDRDDIVDEYITRKLGHLDPRLAAVGRHAYERAEDANATPYPRAHRTLLELSRRGYRLVLITDAPRNRAVRRLQSARLLAFFDHLITLEDTGLGKVTTQPYKIATDRLAALPEDIVMVGDHPGLDVGTARAHGCQTVLAEYGLQARLTSSSDAAPDRKIRWLDELLTLLPPRKTLERALTGSTHSTLGARASGEAIA